MTILISGQPLHDDAQLTDNTATAIFGPVTKRTTVIGVGATETNGGTQTLSIFRVKADGTTTRYYRKNKAVTARERVLIDELIVLNPGETLKAQSGDASGYFDITVTYLAPDAGANR